MEEKLEAKKTETKVEAVSDNRLVIGVNDKNKEIFIHEKSRYYNTLVLGTKGTGKTATVLPMFVEQDLKRKTAGVTIIVSSKEMAYNMYSLAKQYKRKIHFLKPSVNNEIANKFLWMPEYNYDYINENIINYKEAIRRKDVVIIDMELLKYKSDGLKCLAMLLLQLRLDIQETDITQRTPHFLYADDAPQYLKFLEDLMIHSDNYNLGITLFAQSREQFLTPNRDYRPTLDTNVRNTLLLSNLAVTDYPYYKQKFYDKVNEADFFSREANTFLYEMVSMTGNRMTGLVKFKKIITIDFEQLAAISKKIRTNLLKEKRKAREQDLREKYQKENGIKTPVNLSSEPRPIDPDLLDKILANDFAPTEEEVQQAEEELAQFNTEMEAKIKQQVFAEEKEAKRKVATRIFNHYNEFIDYCDEVFDFKYE